MQAKSQCLYCAACAQRSVCARARKTSDKALRRQDALRREGPVATAPPQFFEDPGYVTKSDRLFKKTVIAVALNTSAIYITLGCIGCVLVPAAAERLSLPLADASIRSLQQFPAAQDALLAVGAGLLVTAARYALMAVWPALRDSNDAGNNQVCIHTSADIEVECIVEPRLLRVWSALATSIPTPLLSGPLGRLQDCNVHTHAIVCADCSDTCTTDMCMHDCA